jgi:hypothetical protein
MTVTDLNFKLGEVVTRTRNPEVTMNDNCDPIASSPDLAESQTLGVDGGVAILVLSAPEAHGEVKCGGAVLTQCRPPACSVSGASSGSGGTHRLRAGDRFTDSASSLVVMCIRSGDGVLTFNDRPLTPVVAARTHVRRSAARHALAGFRD